MPPTPVGCRTAEATISLSGWELGGVVAGAPGLYVLGMPVLRTRASTFIHGAAADSNALSRPLLLLPQRQAAAGEGGGKSPVHAEDDVSPLPHIENCAGTAARRPSRNRRVAETDSCRHRASVWSSPVAPYISAASASAIGTSCARCLRSKSLGSELTRPSKASLTSNSERISRGCVTGWRSQSLAACSPLEVVSSCERAGPRLLGCFSAAVIRPSCTSRAAARYATAF